jgi:hypothetical protein
MVIGALFDPNDFACVGSSDAGACAGFDAGLDVVFVC